MAEKMKSEKQSIANQEFELKKHSEIHELLCKIIYLLKEISKNTFPGH